MATYIPAFVTIALLLFLSCTLAALIFVTALRQLRIRTQEEQFARSIPPLDATAIRQNIQMMHRPATLQIDFSTIETAQPHNNPLLAAPRWQKRTIIFSGLETTATDNGATQIRVSLPQ